MHLSSLTRPDLIFVDLPGADGPTVLRAFAERVVERGIVPDADLLYRRLLEREKLGTTALGQGVAVPHCKIEGLDEVVVAVGLFPKGIDFEAADDQPVRLLFLVVSPSAAPAEHLQSLAAISRWVKADHHVERILDLQEPQAIFELLDKETES
jgi:mannitol/fructose-specific phosphotransferase system IIA component (Ntr-type)